jgi:hypothetical protein
MLKCSSCSAEATTRCPRCGMPSCVAHLVPIFGSYGPGVSNQHVCGVCRSASRAVLGIVALFVPVVFLVVVVLTVGLRVRGG